MTRQGAHPAGWELCPPLGWCADKENFIVSFRRKIGITTPSYKPTRSSPRLMNERPKSLCILLPALLWTAALLACSNPRTGTGTAPEEIPGGAGLTRLPLAGLGPADDIDAVDFQVAPDGALHVVWRAAVGALAAPGTSDAAYRLLYARGERGGAAWTPPVELEGRTGKPARIALSSGGLHVVQEDDLRHFVSGDGGRTWQEQPPLLPPGGGRALGLDLLSRGGELLAAYLSRPAAGGLELRTLRWSEAGGAPEAALVAGFPGAVVAQPAPRLAAHDGRLHLLCGLNVERRRTVSSGGRPAEEIEVAGRLLSFESADGGATWSGPAEIAPPEGIDTLAAVELLPSPGRLDAFWSAFGLYVSRWEGGRWSPPAAAAPHGISISQGTYESGPVAAAAAHVAWVDSRFRRSGRRWWNPTGGLPWSDDSPYRAENDLFLLPFPDAPDAPSGPRPRRLTPPGSLVRSLRARAHAGRLILLWAGRPPAGSQTSTSGRAPEIVFITLPLAATRSL